MAKFNFETYAKTAKASTSSTTTRERSNVGYFSLKDDGDYAIIRIATANPKDLDIVTVHKVKHTVNGKDRWSNVSCLRGAYDDLSKCPLCSRGDRVMTRLFIKLVEYTTDESGTVVATPKVWDLPAKYARDLQDIYNDRANGDLSSVLLKVKRRGARGDKSTDYRFEEAPYSLNRDFYVKAFDDFNTLDLAHHSYMEKSYEDLQEFVTTGKFPSHSASTTTQAATPTSQPTYAAPVTPQSTLTYVPPMQQEQPQSQEQTGGVKRSFRFY